MADVIHFPTAQELIRADTLRLEQAHQVALREVGREPLQDTCAWYEWNMKVILAAEAAMRRIN